MPAHGAAPPPGGGACGCLGVVFEVVPGGFGGGGGARRFLFFFLMPPSGCYCSFSAAFRVLVRAFAFWNAAVAVRAGAANSVGAIPFFTSVRTSQLRL